MNHNIVPVSAMDTFCFSCSPAVPCFNECCRDLNQFLTPYDILRLKNELNLASGEFLAQYTRMHTGPESGLPIVTLKPHDTHRLTCPFVTPDGCRVYENRPSSCRTYPLMRAVSRCRKTGKLTEQFWLLKEVHCRGFEAGDTWSVKQWIDQQGAAVYNEFNDRLMEIISLKNQHLPGPLDGKSRQMFYTALYDLDHFRSQIANEGLPDGLGMDGGIAPAILDAAVNDDVALLDLGMQWVKQMLLFRNHHNR